MWKFFRLILACKNHLVKLQRKWDLGRTPPPPVFFKNSHIFPFFSLGSVPYVSKLELQIHIFLAAHMGADSLGYQDDDHPEKVRTLPSYVCGCRSPGSSASAALNCL